MINGNCQIWYNRQVLLMGDMLHGISCNEQSSWNDTFQKYNAYMINGMCRNEYWWDFIDCNALLKTFSET